MLVFVSALVFLISVTTIDALEFQEPSLEERYYALLEVIRCPKCLNTNLAGSDAPIAQDLRKLVHRLLHEGKTDKEIREHLVERYGEFILYDPPLSPTTLFLWILPIVGVLLVGWLVLKLGVKKDHTKLEPEEERMLQELDGH